jgi:hypothetical protein
VRRVAQRVVVRRPLARADPVDLARIAIIASQKRSSSARSSLSVGSTISVPATGNDIVGAWKP